MNPTIRSLTSGGKQSNYSNNVLCCLLPTPSAVWPWCENLLSGQSEEYSALVFFNSVKENKFFENSRTLLHSRTISALYYVTKPELVEKQTVHKADLIPSQRVILTG